MEKNVEDKKFTGRENTFISRNLIYFKWQNTSPGTIILPRTLVSVHDDSLNSTLINTVGHDDLYFWVVGWWEITTYFLVLDSKA